MSRRSTSIKIATKAAILFGALFLVTVLIAAIPAHQQKAFEVVITPETQAQSSTQLADSRPVSGKTSQQTSAAHHRSNRTYKTITRPK